MYRQFIQFLLVLTTIVLIPVICPDVANARRVLQIPQKIDDQHLRAINDIGNMKNFNEILDNILIPRVVGTVGHQRVNEYIKNTMKNLQWTVETDKFNERTPIKGKLQFENIIATVNPNADRFLVMACHYDSKYFPNEEFLGAIDSAVPCAMLINLAMVLDSYIDQNRGSAKNVSLKFVFFDGEEAFKEWSSTDSIYGARHLAAKWQQENFLPKIDMLVLLDLLGAPDPKFFSFFKSTENWYAHLCEIEERFAEAGLLSHFTFSGVNEHSSNLYFQPRTLSAQIEDDHIPFLKRNVPIMHLIPVPFPTVWHTMDDNRDVIDMETVENLNRIFRVFVIEYLHLEMN